MRRILLYFLAAIAGLLSLISFGHKAYAFGLGALVAAFLIVCSTLGTKKQQSKLAPAPFTSATPKSSRITLSQLTAWLSALPIVENKFRVGQDGYGFSDERCTVRTIVEAIAILQNEERKAVTGLKDSGYRNEFHPCSNYLHYMQYSQMWYDVYRVGPSEFVVLSGNNLDGLYNADYRWIDKHVT